MKNLYDFGKFLKANSMCMKRSHLCGAESIFKVERRSSMIVKFLGKEAFVSKNCREV